VSALRHGNNGDYVFVLNNDRTVTQRPVKAGQASVDKVQIASGLQAGERVITEGADRLRDGSRVILPGDNPQAARGGASGARGGGSGARRNASSAGPASDASAAQGGPQRHQGTSASDRANSGASAPSSAPANGSPASAPPMAAGPTPEQRQRMLDAVKDDPDQLERRKRFLEAIDRGDPQALDRWRQMQQRRAQGGGGGQ
jgi:multidrug efflux system membrane fusion protein